MELGAAVGRARPFLSTAQASRQLHHGRLRASAQSRGEVAAGNPPSPWPALPQRGTQVFLDGRLGRCAAARAAPAATTRLEPGAAEPVIPFRRSLNRSGMGAGVSPPAPRCSALLPGTERPEPAPASPAPTFCPAGPRRPGKLALEEARPQPSAGGGWEGKGGEGEGRTQGKKGGLMGKGANGRNMWDCKDPPPPEPRP